MIDLKKQDLKTGMRVTLRNGEKFITFINVYTHYVNKSIDFLVNCDKPIWENLDKYQNNLIYLNEDKNEFDIVMIEVPNHPYSILGIKLGNENLSYFSKLWERR